MSESHDTAERLTRTERGDLQKIARMRARQSKAMLDARKAELLADLEEQLSAKFPANDPRWATVTSEAQKAVAQANDVIRGICQDEGVPLEFAPSLNLSWYSRGENAAAERRAELRALGQRKIDASAKYAKVEIDRVELDVCTAIIADGLRSSDAREYLERIPEPAQLMCPVTLDEVESERQAAKVDRAHKHREVAARFESQSGLTG